MRYLEDEKLLLRPLEPEDLDLLYQWENDTTLWQYGDTLTPLSRYTLKDYIQASQQGLIITRELHLIIQDKAANDPVGIIELNDYDHIHQRAAIGMLIHPDHQRRGYGARSLALLEEYAFNKLHLNQLYAFINATNAASISLFTKSRYTISGRIEQWTRSESGWDDTVIFQRINTNNQ